ncbi:MAG: FAD-dependent oxidoreductase [Deltaproteobacteria bacterium]|nr:FAD-dependent oxidoreductase [Deltaproteobacteria bacterium]
MLLAYARRPSGDVDVVVIGGGAAGLTAAGFAASVGAKTLLIERERLGGDCTWTGCIPSKALLKAASVAHAARNASKYGLKNAEPEADLARVLERVREVQEHVYREADAPEVIERFGVEVMTGKARFVARDAVEITRGDGSRRRVRFRDAIVCSGSRPRLIAGLEGVPHLTNESVFSLTKLPRRLLVLGAGPIGVELGQAFARLGSVVTILDRERDILPNDDPAHAAVLRERLASEGVRFRLDAAVRSVERRGDETHLSIGDEVLVADELLVAVGRAPNVEDLGLEVAGVATNERGIVVDERCRTSNHRVYACGDVAGRLQLTHWAEHMAKVAVANAVLGVPLRLERDVVPWVTFTEPELAHVGRRTVDPREHRTYRFPYSKVDRAVAERDDVGWVQVHADRAGRIVGASVVGRSAGEVVAELALAMKHGIPLRKIADTIHAYPTLALAARRVSDQWYVQRTAPALLRMIMTLRGLRGRCPSRPQPDAIV